MENGCVTRLFPKFSKHWISGIATIFGPPPQTTCWENLFVNQINTVQNVSEETSLWPRGYGDYFFLAGQWRAPSASRAPRGRGPAGPSLRHCIELLVLECIKTSCFPGSEEFRTRNASTCQIDIECPADCTCDRTTINCSGRRLTQVPVAFPSYVTEMLVPFQHMREWM